jgi:hypothetical protein
MEIESGVSSDNPKSSFDAMVLRHSTRQSSSSLWFPRSAMVAREGTVGALRQAQVISARGGGGPCWPTREEVMRGAAAREAPTVGQGETTPVWAGSDLGPNGPRKGYVLHASSHPRPAAESLWARSAV